MPSLPKDIADFMAAHGVSFDEVWKIPQGNAYAVKHKALERIAANLNIKFDHPTVVQSDLANKTVAIVVFASLGDRHEWATGEAAPYNNKNGYPLAMAEKRAKDRVILKLLHAHGSLYSEDEADDFKRPNPHVTRPEDVSDAVVEYDSQGEPIDNIPSGDPGIDRLPKSKARTDFEAAQKEMHSTQTVKQLNDWGARNANRVQSYPPDWAEIMRKLFAEHLSELRKTSGVAA